MPNEPTLDPQQDATSKGMVLAHRLQLAQEIAKLVRARFPLTHALQNLSGQAGGPFSQAIDAVKQRLQAGHSLSASLAQGDDAATRMLAACIELGEKSGRLDRALDIWADYYFTRQQYLRRVTSAVVYPLLLVIVALASILYSAWRLIPQYKQAFNQLAESQPAWLRALEFVELNFAWFAIVIVATTFTVLWRCLANRHGVDRLGIPRSQAMHYLLNSQIARMCELGVKSGQAVSDWLGLVLLSVGLKLEAPLDRCLVDERWSRRLGRETCGVLIGLNAGQINATDSQSLLQTIGDNSATQADLAIERQVHRLPMITSLVVGVVAVATYLCLIYFPWLALYYHISQNA